MRKANSICPVEHDDVLVGTEIAVIKRIAETERGEIFEQCGAGVGSEWKFGIVIHVQHGALVVVSLGAELDPAFVITKIDGFVFRIIDVRRPEEADVAIAKDVLVRLAPIVEVDVMGGDQFEARPAFEMKSGCGRLVKLSLAFGYPGKSDRCVTGLEENFVVASEFMIAIEDVFMVETCDGEEGPGVRAVGQSMHAIVARAMTFIRFIIADHRGEVANLKCFTRHG